MDDGYSSLAAGEGAAERSDRFAASGAGPAPEPQVAPPMVVFSHLRWDFVRQRPQHLLSRFARERDVWVWEEHIPCDHPRPYLEHHHFPEDRVTSLRPRLPHWWSREELEAGLAALYDHFAETALDTAPVHWFYTPMLLPVVGGAGPKPAAVVYDCMDELSAFAHADPLLLQREQMLLDRADLVLTGGRSLYEAKRHRHGNVHAFPSAVDADHFAQARSLAAANDGVTLGWFGVIDERFDVDLIAAVAKARPQWRFEMLGPVVKIDPATLPRLDNLRWAGPASYDQLPAALARWDVALMPFARNDATRFISPTKTPEYLAGGVPVVSTSITDVVADYGHLEAVWIADTPDAFIAAIELALKLPRGGKPGWLAEADDKLAEISWDRTHAAMRALMARAVRERAAPGAPSTPTLIPTRRAEYDTLVVGAGFAGSVMAERLAADAGQRVLVIDRRDHVGGNAYDHLDDAGVLVHRYGPHIFHTNSDDVFAYLSRFTSWRAYEHRVLAEVGGQLVPMPINRTTLEKLYGVTLDSDDAAAAFLAARAEPRDPIETSEDVVVNAIGRELYETFFRGYTRKQWALDPSQLDKSVTARVPTRTSRDDRYFQDKHQAMPAEGYTRMFERMLDHPNITVKTSTDFADVADVARKHTVYTGPIDAYFGHRFGKLPYRSLRFVNETRDVEQVQAVGTVNFPAEDVPYTRVTEYKHLTGQQHPKTSLTWEYPTAEGDPYYPIPRPENQALFRQYDALANATPDVTFVGRLANYRYYNMDQVVGQALATYRRLRERLPLAG